MRLVRTSLALAVLLTLTAPVAAQHHTDHRFDSPRDLVATIKAQVVAEGIDITTPCGGFEIAKRVAWDMRMGNAGLLAKLRGGVVDGSSLSPYGCGVDGILYAYDIVIYPNGQHYDILQGDTLDTLWHLVEIEGTHDPYLRPEAYHPAIEPHVQVPTPAGPPVVVDPPVVDPPVVDPPVVVTDPPVVIDPPPPPPVVIDPGTPDPTPTPIRRRTIFETVIGLIIAALYLLSR